MELKPRVIDIPTCLGQAKTEEGCNCIFERLQGSSSLFLLRDFPSLFEATNASAQFESAGLS